MNIKNLTNRKGGFQAVVVGLAIMVVGSLLYIILDLIMRGGSSGEGILYLAENTFNMSDNQTAYGVVKNTWMWAPVLLIIIGIIYALVNTQREEFFRQPI